MTTTLRTSFAAAGLASLVLAGSCSIVSGDTTVISTFDSDLSSSPNGYSWYNIDLPAPTAFQWVNTDQNGAGATHGSMHVILDWPQGTGPWEYQDKKLQVEPWGVWGAPPTGVPLDLVDYDHIEFDAKVLVDVSQPNYAGNYGGIMAVAQSWPGWGDNPPHIDAGYQNLGISILPTTDGWAHFSFSTSAWPWTLGRLTLVFFSFGNLESPTHTEVLIDNVRFTTIPEPGSLALLSLGLIAVLGRRKRRS